MLASAERPPPFLTGTDQRHRWQRAGYDIDAATARFRAFKARLPSVTSGLAADAAILAFCAGEQDLARQQGVADTDPDFWRIGAASKHILWTAPLDSAPLA